MPGRWCKGWSWDNSSAGSCLAVTWALTQPPSWKKLKGLLMFHSINSYLKTQTDIDHLYIIYIYTYCVYIYIYVCVCVCVCMCVYMWCWKSKAPNMFLGKTTGLPQPENLCHRRVHWGVHHPRSKINKCTLYIYTTILYKFHLKSHPIKQPPLIHQLKKCVVTPHESSTIINYHQLSSTIINYYQLLSTSNRWFLFMLSLPNMLQSFPHFNGSNLAHCSSI